MILLMGDLFVAFFALLIALYFWGQRDIWLSFSLQFLSERPPFWFYLMPLIWLVLIVELYDVRRAARRRDTLEWIGIAAGVSLVLYTIIFFVSQRATLPRYGVSVYIITVSVLTLLWRLLYIRVFTAPSFLRRVLVVGAGRAGSTLAQIVTDMHPHPFYLVGYVDDDPQKIGLMVEGFPVLGGGDRLMEIIEERNVTDLAMAITGEMNPDLFQMLMKAEEMGIEVTSMPILYEELLGRVPIFLLQSDWILRSFLDQAHTGGLFEIGKRLMDIVGGLIGVAAMVMVFPFVGLLTILDTGFPILYTQTRLGKNGRVYNMIKFRTMIKDAEKDGRAHVTIVNDQRITRAGKFLRKSHLDELPQFINILSGDMSLVGPRAERPEIVDFLQEKIPFYRARLLVRPGLSGWAQINYKYATNAAENAIKLEYDLYYIKHRNLMLDLSILVRTLGTVIGLRGR